MSSEVETSVIINLSHVNNIVVKVMVFVETIKQSLKKS